MGTPGCGAERNVIRWHFRVNARRHSNTTFKPKCHIATEKGRKRPDSGGDFYLYKRLKSMSQADIARIPRLGRMRSTLHETAGRDTHDFPFKGMLPDVFRTLRGSVIGAASEKTDRVSDGGMRRVVNRVL